MFRKHGSRMLLKYLRHRLRLSSIDLDEKYIAANGRKVNFCYFFSRKHLPVSEYLKKQTLLYIFSSILVILVITKMGRKIQRGWYYRAKILISNRKQKLILT